MHRRVWLPLVVTVVLALAVGAALLVSRVLATTAYEDALDALPGSTLRASYTDWSSLGAEQAAATSALVESAEAMDRDYGLSPADASWEVYGQSPEGAVAVLQLGESADLPGLERTLRSLGYTAPVDGPGEVWAGSPDLVAGIDSTLTPVLQNVAVLREERRVLLSDDADYLASVVGEDSGSLLETPGVSALAGEVEEPVAAVLFASDFACDALGTSTASPADQARAEQLVDRAGGVHPLAGLSMMVSPDRSMTVGLHLETSEQASEDLRPRTELATGEAVGQGGTFTERFSLTEARASDTEIFLDLEPVGEAELLADLSQGPVLFAGC